MEGINENDVVVSAGLCGAPEHLACLRQILCPAMAVTLRRSTQLMQLGTMQRARCSRANTADLTCLPPASW
jgi:hypothetical protein